MNNLPRVVARIMPRSESNPRPLDHESNALPLHYRVTLYWAVKSVMIINKQMHGQVAAVTFGGISALPQLLYGVCNFD